MGFFTPRRRRNSAYDVYNRYTDGYNRPQYEGEGLTSSYGLSRNSSMMNGAGFAAAAALKIHQDNGGDRQAYFQDQQGLRRAQSLAGGRTHSVRSYVYHPKPSYNAGDYVGRSPAKRYNSMTGRTGEYVGLSRTNLLAGRTQLLTGRSQLFTGRNSMTPTRGNAYGGSVASPQQVKTLSTIDEARHEEEEGVTVTTNTTKVVDSLGRVQSITTETVKTYPDGSTVSDKSVKNISRNNSRASSLNSYSYGAKGNRSNSLREGVSTLGPSYNLSKIDELHDFDSSYVYRPTASEEIPGGYSENLEGKEKLNLNSGQNAQQLRQASDYESKTAPQPSKLDSMNSTSKESVRSIRSILKKGNAVDVGAEIKDDERNMFGGSHPFKTLAMPNKQARSDDRDKNRAENLQAQNKPNEQSAAPSMLSKTSPIKFNEKVQTIHVPNENQENQENQEPLSNEDMYNIAMKAAVNKVYGNREEKAFDLNDDQTNIGKSVGVPQTGKKFLKNEKKIENFSHQGLGTHYDYQNHHRDFVGLSLRNNNTKKKQKLVDTEKKRKQAETQQEAEHKEAPKEESHEENQESAPDENLKEKKDSKKNKKQGKRFNLGGLFHNRRKSTSERQQSNDNGKNEEEDAYVVRLPMSVTYGDGADDQGVNIEPVENKQEDSSNAERPVTDPTDAKKSAVAQANENSRPKDTAASRITKPAMQKDSSYVEVPSHAFIQEDKSSIGAESSVREIDNADDAVTAPLKKLSFDEPFGYANSGLENRSQKLKEKLGNKASNFDQVNSELPADSNETENKEKTSASNNYSPDNHDAVFVPPNSRLAENSSSYGSHYSSSDKPTSQNTNENAHVHDDNASQREGLIMEQTKMNGPNNDKDNVSGENADAVTEGNDELNKVGNDKGTDGFVLNINGKDESTPKAGEVPVTGDEISSDTKDKRKGQRKTRFKSNKKSEKFKHNFLKLFVNTYVGN